MSRPRYLFHADAAGLAATIHRPFHHTLDIQAATALPPSGGIGNSSMENIGIPGILHCKKVTSHVSGAFHPASHRYETRVVSISEKVDLGNGIVTADLIRAEVHSSYSANDLQPFIVPFGSAIENLKVRGQDLEVENLSDTFTTLNTLEKLEDKHRNDQVFQEQIHDYCMVGKHDDLKDDDLQHYFPFCRRKPRTELPETKHVTILPLFRIGPASGHGFRVVQNVIYIHNFGRLHLGELIISANERRLTGLHLDLGSPTGGYITANAVSASIGETESVGSKPGETIPPEGQ